MRTKATVYMMLIFLVATALSAAQWTTFNTSNSGLASNSVRTIVIDANGNKWFGTDKGLSAFDGTTWVTYEKQDTKQTLADNKINDIAFEITSYGPELWIATDNGISVFAIPSIDAVTQATPYRTDNTGLISNKVTVAAVDTLRHQRWFGTQNGVSLFTGSEWRNFDRESDPPLAWDNVTDIGVDPQGGWKYICTVNGQENERNGVSRLRTIPDSIDAITAPSPYSAEWSGLYSPNVLCVFMDSDGSQWFGTEEGFGFHDSTETKGGWSVFTTFEGLVNDTVQAIVKGENQVAWIGTPNGLDRFEYEFGQFGIDNESVKFTTFTTEDGLASNNILDLVLDTDGTLWVATDNGVSHYGPGTHVAKEDKTAPKSFGLVKNFPNPFNPSTTITYSLPSNAHVELYIVNMKGERIRGLVNTVQSSGEHKVTWNGTLENGDTAPTGIYLAQLLVQTKSMQFRDSIKMLFVK